MLRMEEVLSIHDLHRQGLSVQAIARHAGLDRKTVRKYLKRGLEPPAYGPRPPPARPSTPILGPPREQGHPAIARHVTAGKIRLHSAFAAS